MNGIVVQWQCVAATVVLVLSAVGTVAGGEEPPRFNRDVRPILSDKCFRCHGPDGNQRQADLRLDQEAGVRDAFGGKSGSTKAVDLESSEAWQRIHSSDPDEKMPPPASGLSLSAGEQQTIKQWLAEGAAWEGHWAFLPIRRPPVPRVADHVVRNPIDAFVLARLARAGVRPVDSAVASTRIRRLSLDLVGLPPSANDAAAFVQSPSDAAYEAAVDRYLASPGYGERMALFWLDLVRYADSVGYHKDSHRDCWMYRDYVIGAFNRNLPYDQFVAEQLAGDLLDGSKFDKFRRRIASGFNRMNQTTSEGGAQPKEYLAKYSADRVRNTAAIFLGTTVGCSECHDHKYDPFTTRDFYRFAAFFADVQERGVGYPAHTPMPSPAQIDTWQTSATRLAALRQQQQAESAAGPDGRGQQASDNRPKGQATSLQTEIAKLEARIKKLSNAKSWQKTLVTTAGKPRAIRILPRGNWLDDSGEAVSPAIPQFLGRLELGDRKATRLDLAGWITSPDNPLTARVLVNRLWSLYFGEGLSRTLDDLGAQGQWPTHPDLLDWLAAELIDSGWDMKHIVKRIVMSDAYQRSSRCPPALVQRDPENRLLARQTSYRLPAELVRDNILSISGLLSSKMGGRSVRPYQPANYWYRLYKDAKYVQDHGDDLYRRGVYTYWRRSFWHPSLRAFDAPAREECVAQRPRSNTPAQSLVLLNDPQYVEAARVLATRQLRDGGDSDAAKVDWAYRRALARPPLARETQVMIELVAAQRRRYEQEPAAARQLIQVGESPVPDDLPAAELAAWTSAARVLLNLHETITRD